MFHERAVEAIADAMPESTADVPLETFHGFLVAMQRPLFLLFTREARWLGTMSEHRFLDFRRSSDDCRGLRLSPENRGGLQHAISGFGHPCPPSP